MTPDDEAQTPAERIARDGHLRLVVETAARWGVPPTVLMGRRVVTTYRHDLGVLATSSRDEWTDEDVALAVGLVVYEATGRCPHCHGPLHEVTAPEAEDRYLPAPPVRCHQCTAVSQAQALTKTDYHPGALLHGARIREDHDVSHQDP